MNDGLRPAFERLACTLRAGAPLIEPVAAAWLDQRPPRERWHIACSGGADSTFLVGLIWALYPQRHAAIEVIYVDHRLRAETAAEAQHVQAIAAALGLRFTMRSVPNGTPSDEASLRTARYQALLQAAESEAVLLLGQHLDDYLEGLLMRLLRGSDLDALTSPTPVRHFGAGVEGMTAHWRVRPLLNLSGEQVRAMLKAAGIGWCEDASNQSPAYTRNRLRQMIVPQLRTLCAHGGADGLQRSRQQLTESAAALRAWTERECALRLHTGPSGEVTLRLAADGGPPLPRAIVRRLVLAAWAQVASGECSGALLEAILSAHDRNQATGGSLNARYNWRYAEGVLRFECPPHSGTAWRSAPVCWLATAVDLALPGGGWLCAARVDASGLQRVMEANRSCPATSGLRETTVVLNVDCGPHLWVRIWREGDRYRRLGAPGRRKLQDLFGDAGIAPALRHRLPVLTDSENAILWVPGLGIAAQAAVRKGAKQALRLTYQLGCSPCAV